MLGGTLLQMTSAFLSDDPATFLRTFWFLLLWWAARGVVAVGIWLWAGYAIGRPRLILRHLIGSVVCCLSWAVIAAAVPVLSSSVDGDFGQRCLRILVNTVVFTQTMYWAIVGARHAVHYLWLARLRERRAAELEARLAHARLASIRAQFNPHFLFNALNGITALAIDRQHDRVVGALGALGDLLRRVLTEGEEEISLEREMTFVDQYLALQSLRLGDRLTIDLAIAPNVTDCAVPSMLLQPVVENAVIHGIEPFREPGRLAIRADRAGDRVAIAVTDTGPGFPNGATLATGLANVQARLEQSFGPGGTMSTRRIDQTTEVLLTFPYRRHDSNSDCR